MNIYVCLPEAFVRNHQQSAVLGCRKELAECLRSYYGRNISVELCGAGADARAAVYVMGKPSYEGLETEIRKSIVDCVSRHFSGLSASNLDIKLNYAAFNPNFKPKVLDMDRAPVKEVQAQSRTSENNHSKSEEYDYEKLSLNYTAEEPRYSFEQVILPEKTRIQIEEAIGVIEVEEKVFDEWGLRSIIPYAASALSFYGPPGTGKSMAAEAVAHKMGRKILSAAYADIESKFHGEGPKMVKAIFKAAERENAVLFLDESDSLLSKRLTNVSDGSAQAINSMRSQLLISLEHFKGIVIFATNLVVNYDKAFLSRLINIEFAMPDKEARLEIWERHLRGRGIHLPLALDIDMKELADKYEFCGREIKNAVKNAAIAVALQKRSLVTQMDLIKACEITKEESQKAVGAKDYTKADGAALNARQNDALRTAMQNKIDKMQSV